MTGIALLRITLVVIFAINGVLLTVILIVKPMNRYRQLRHDRRRAAYVSLLSQHLARTDHRVDMGKKVAEDMAFLDALIDMRSIVIGPEADALSTIVNHHGIAERQSRRLRQTMRTDLRLRAAVALAELADISAAPVLMEYLADDDPEVRIQCARGLSRIRWTPAINAILTRFDQETPWVRSRFADSLIEFGDQATWPLLAHINMGHRLGLSGTSTAVRTLGGIGDPQAAEPLVAILEDAFDPEVQIAIVETLGALGLPIALETIEKATRSEDWRLRAKAATAMATLGDDSAVTMLAQGIEDESWWVRRNSAAGLARFPAGIDLLYETILSEDSFARDAAAEALGDAGEVIAAQDRIAGGTASTRDFDLIEYVTHTPVVTT